MWLSIIIPIYNVSQYITECVNSIMVQSVSGIDVMMVDDGSTDGSVAVCRALSIKYPMCHFMEQTHAGVSAARNTGLRNVTGEFILFVDGDDFLTPGALDEIFNKISSREIDILFTSMNNYDNDTGIATYNQLQCSSDSAIRSSRGPEILSDLFSHNHNAVWNIRHVFRRTFLLDKSIFFDHALSCSEDCHFFMQAVLSGSSCDISSFPVYNYRRGRSGSTITTMGQKCLADKMKTADYWCNKILLDDSFSKHMKAGIIPAFAVDIFNAIPGILQFDDAKSSEPYSLLVKNKHFMNYLSDKKKRMKWIVYRFFGYRLGQSILDRYTAVADFFKEKS